MNQIRGTVKKIAVTKNASGDTVQTISFEVFGDISWLNNLMDSPLVIEVKPE